MKTGWKKHLTALGLAIVLLAGLLVPGAAADGGPEQAKNAAVDCLKAAVADKCPIATYETDDPLISVASYTYESAVAALALMSEGDYEDAAKILDAFVQGMKTDSEFKDRFRNAYMAGSPSDLPGYWNNEQAQWLQDAYHVGTGTKSSSAAAVALLTYHGAKPREDYLNAAVAGIDWILDNCQDGNPGFTAGYTGWKTTGAFTDLTYKSTTDNLWMAAACRLLETATGWSKYGDAAQSAETFVKEKMYSAGDSRFFQGTQDDGETPVAGLILTDVQALAALCLDDDSGLDNMDKCLAKDGGYSYDISCCDGSWLEGTAIAALALKQTGNDEKAEAALQAMAQMQLPSGSFPQASIAELKTGEQDRTLNDWPSVAPCAWFILAVNGVNPLG